MSEFLNDIEDLPINDPDLSKLDTVAKIIEASKTMSAHNDAETRISNLRRLTERIALLKDVYQRNAVIKEVAKDFKIKATILSAEVTYLVTERENAERKVREIAIDDEEAPLPPWVDKDKLYSAGFVQLYKNEPHYPIGIYFKGQDKRLKRVTNYCIDPIAHIAGSDSRRLVQITHVYKNAVIELSDQAMVTEAAFSKELISKGPFRKEPGFTTLHFMSIINPVIDDAKEVQELNTLGWNANGFFSFSNIIGLPSDDQSEQIDRLVSYNSYGLATVRDRMYYSPAVSSANTVEIGEDNIYENDLYLKYVESPVKLGDWMRLFCEVYEERGRLGLAFLFITLFKDIVTTVTKCPHLYCYGPKDSGKSAMCESIMYFVFSGRDSSGEMMKGYNVSRGMGTPFSFHNGNERFRNTPRILNEFDLNNVEDFVRGAIKAAYDGEARQVGDGMSYKKKKTRSQKVHCSLMVIGQYLDTSDDGSIPSRSIIPQAFSRVENDNRSKEAQRLFFRLRDLEQAGLSSLVLDVLSHRQYIQRHLKATFSEIKDQLATAVMEKNDGKPAEQRILNNYTLCLAMIRLMGTQVAIPFSYDDFFLQVKETILRQNALIKDSSILTIFWSILEILHAEREIVDRKEFKIVTCDRVKVKKDNVTEERQFDKPYTKVLYIRFTYLHTKFAKIYSEKYKKPAPNETTMLNYIQDQPYFIGLCPGTHFSDTKTSAYMLYYDKVGVNLETDVDQDENVERMSNKHRHDEPADNEKMPF